MHSNERVFTSNHPLIKHKLSLLRRVDTEPKKFLDGARDLDALGYERHAIWRLKRLLCRPLWPKNRISPGPERSVLFQFCRGPGHG